MNNKIQTLLKTNNEYNFILKKKKVKTNIDRGKQSHQGTS